MKSYGQLWERIVSEENLREAWLRVRRGHASSPAVRAFEARLDSNLAELRARLADGSYRPRGYWQFRIHDPKPRTISCAPVCDRVVHHALCGVVTPLMERTFVPVSFACRKGYGSHAACALARRYAKRAQYFCKMDVRKYFDSIDHGRLLAVLLPMFREERVKSLLRMIVESPVPGLPAGRGMPIGNLTSQWFANLFLSAFDHAALTGFGGRKPAGYLRYMDDFVFFAGSKAEAWRLHDEARRWLAEERGLEVKDEATVVAPVTEGVPFLGLRIWPNCWRLRRARFLRTRRTFAARVRQYAAGELDERRFAQCAASSDGAARWFGFKGILRDWAPEEDAAGSYRVLRGGSWNNNANNCRSANRNNDKPDNDNNDYGFRLASALPGQTGSHSGTPAPRDRAGTNMHGPGRPVAQATAAPGPRPLDAAEGNVV